MEHSFAHYGVVTFINFLIISFSISLLVMQSDGRYLRPSDHGLADQNASTPTKDDDPEMVSFFKGGRTPASFQSNTSMSLPEARNMSSSSGNSTETWWNRRRRSSNSDSGKNRLREVLLLASLVCGLTGFLLLVFSAFVFLFRCRKQKQQQKLEVEKQKTLPSLALAPAPATSTSTLALVSGSTK